MQLVAGFTAVRRTKREYFAECLGSEAKGIDAQGFHV
jgi:hypothetical protein